MRNATIYQQLPAPIAQRLQTHRVTRSLRRPPRLFTDTTDFTAIDYGDVIAVDDRYFLVTSYTKEGRFGVDEQIKPWVPKVVDLATMQSHIVKLEFHETFEMRLGQFAVTCYRSPEKEARILELVRGRAHFMQGRTLIDEAGNLVRILDPISGNRLDKSIHTGTNHYDYFCHELPALLSQLVLAIEEIAFLHAQGFRHGDIRRDHIFIDRHTGTFLWIDFDYDFYLPEKPFALDLVELGNVLIYLVARGDFHPREIMEHPDMGPSTLANLGSEDFSLITPNRVVNLQKLFPYIPARLNRVLLHFGAGTPVFYETVDELAGDLAQAVAELVD